MFTPPTTAPQAPPWLPGSLPAGPVPSRPNGPAPTGMTWDYQTGKWVSLPSGGTSAPLGSNYRIADSSFNGASGMDWLMHPAGTAVREAYRRGDIQGPKEPSSVTSQMAASQAPANMPGVAAAQSVNNVSINTTNNGTLQGEDHAAALVTGAQVRRSGWHPSMQVV